MTGSQARARTLRGERIPIALVVHIHDTHGVTHATSVNVSLGGMQLLLEGAIAPDVSDRIDLEFELPELDLPVRVAAEVRWVASGERRVGVCFVRGLRPREVWALARLARGLAQIAPTEIFGNWNR